MIDGQIEGWYNLVTADTYETFDNQISVAEYIDLLRDEDVPEQVTVTGLEEAFAEGEADELADAIDEHGNWLESMRPRRTVQFAVEGTFQQRGEVWHLLSDEHSYPLEAVFGPETERKDEGWLMAPF